MSIASRNEGGVDGTRARSEHLLELRYELVLYRHPSILSG